MTKSNKKSRDGLLISFSSTNERFCLSQKLLDEPVLLLQILAFYGTWKHFREICRSTGDVVCRFLKVVSLSKETPENVVWRIAKAFPNLAFLLLDGVLCVSNELVTKIMHLSNLRYLSLNYCLNLSSDCFVNKPGGLVVSIQGCWRVLDPNSSISAVSVVEIQLLALQSGSFEGIEKMLAFVSTLHKEEIRSNFLFRLKPSFRGLIFNQGFLINKLCETEFQCLIIVTINCFDGARKHFLWTLTHNEKISNGPRIWETDVIQAFHPY